ncbi:RNA polymerase sigma-70 factor (ECF subfamily) [Bacillus pakistanensis]|uniref:RNA polymerase sigma-70 factor (ECF subfamily) n=2 Tax=Rossellomorea pakistanensis TaxID=992288 RepID=A0ABS2NJI9_9BACI|nr:RNA polymerase sigma-70 factor (ECF subfamily) [Bacillus pakistanensis]
MNNDHLQSLMLRYQKGDEEALEHLYVYLKGPLYEFLFRYCRDEQLSIDLVQDAFVKLQQNKVSFAPEKSNIKTYLYQIGYNLMITKLNRRTKWRKLLPFLLFERKPSEFDDEHLSLRQLLMQLPEKQRAIIILHYFDDMTQKDIAEVLNLPLGTVKSRLHHGIKTLKSMIEKEDD